MADGASIQLSGMDDILRAFKRLGEKEGKKIVRKATRNGTKIIAKEIKARAPEDTGTLKRSITVRARRKRRKNEISFSTFFNTAKFPQLLNFSLGSKSDIGTRKFSGQRYFYPAALEYGTNRMNARPFVRPAWDSKKRVALDTVLTQIRSGIEREAKK